MTMTTKIAVHKNGLEQFPDIQHLLEGADHIDVKTIQSDLPLRTFIAGLLGHQPAWMTFLYRVRWLFVRLLGMQQQGVPRPTPMTAADVPMTPGAAAGFFKVVAAAEERYWFAGASESHLTAKLGVAVAPLAATQKRFHVITVVHYNSWAGPVYFNVIRPFHHLVVHQMMQEAIRSQSPELAGGHQ